MDNLEFRKFLTTYGITYSEYETMEENKKQELQQRFAKEQKQKNYEDKGEKLKAVGKGIQGVGCLLILIPVLLVFLGIIWAIITS